MIPNVPAPWPRNRYQAAGPARLAWVVLLPDAGELPAEHPLVKGFQIEARYYGDDPAWFDGWMSPRSTYGAALMRTPGLDMVALGSCKAAMTIAAEVEDPNDLGYLQRALLLVRLLAEKAGAVAACDVEALRWWTKADLEELPADLDFEISDHVRVVFEPTEREPGQGHICHTLGMAKFGRPDLALPGMLPEHVEAAVDLLEKMAGELADGENFETGDVVEFEGFPPLRCEELPDDSGTDDVTFGNRSLWLIPEEG